MKKTALLALPFAGVLFLSSCGGKTNAALSVYLVQTDALYVSALGEYASLYPERKMDLQTFPTYDEMAERLSTELMSGKGPDLLLFNSLQGSIDVQKLATSNAFLPLDDQMESLSADDYFVQIFDAGKIDGKQQLLPLSWNILQSYSKEGTASEGLMLDILAAEAEALASQSDMALCSLNFERDDAMNLMLEVCGVSLTGEDGRLSVDEAAFRRAAEATKLYYDQMAQIQAVGQRYRNDFAGAASHVSFLLENFSFMNNLRYYQTTYPTLLSTEMDFHTFDRLDGGLTAQVVEFAAINRSSKQADAAWEVLQYLLDAPYSMDFSKYEQANVYYAPVNRKTYENCVTQLATQGGQGPKIRLEPLNADNAELLRQLPGRVTEAVIPNPTMGGILQECLEPYFMGDKDFESCYAEFQNKAALYLDE